MAPIAWPQVKNLDYIKNFKWSGQQDSNLRPSAPKADLNH